MEKTINSFEVRRSFGKLMHDVATHGDKIIVERHGIPVAVLVPVTLYEQWKQNRERFFEALHASQDQANRSEEEAMALAQEAVQAVRAQKRV